MNAADLGRGEAFTSVVKNGRSDLGRTAITAKNG